MMGAVLRCILADDRVTFKLKKKTAADQRGEPRATYTGVFLHDLYINQGVVSGWLVS